MEIRVLGCSGGFGAGLRTSSFLVDDRVLLDAGTGLGDLDRATLHGIRDVFLTHAHLDHTASLPMLVDTLFTDLDRPLVVHGPPETIEALRAHLFNGEIWPDFSVLPTADHPVLRFDPMAPGDTRTVDGLEIESIPVAHTVPAVAYRCADADGAFCFSGDTGTNDTLWAVLNQRPPLELLIVEVGCPDGEAALARAACHYCPSTLGADLAKLAGRPRVAVTHLRAGAEARTMDELRAALPAHELHRLQSGERLQL